MSFNRKVYGEYTYASPSNEKGGPVFGIQQDNGFIARCEPNHPEAQLFPVSKVRQSFYSVKCANPPVNRIDEQENTSAQTIVSSIDDEQDNISLQTTVGSIANQENIYITKVISDLSEEILNQYLSNETSQEQEAELRSVNYFGSSQ
ncbi:MAG: hypothetical protein SFW66_00910 [Gammaproteobacteria bacterium]|nr:hypothetical protein [Gammaproteobacteria bacterium]